MPQLSDKAEEILEHLWISTQEQDTRPTADALPEEELAVLEREGLVVTEAGTIQLTPGGLEEARACIRRHRLAERLLSDVLDSSDEQLHAAGCKFEHGLHHGLQEQVCTMLGHPERCPHGKPIPSGECCRRKDSTPGQVLVPLSEMESGQEGVIAYLHSDRTEDLRKLMAIGALPGTRLRLRQRFPSYLLRLGNSEFAVDAELAGQVYVRRTGGAE